MLGIYCIDKDEGSQGFEVKTRIESEDKKKIAIVIEKKTKKRGLLTLRREALYQQACTDYLKGHALHAWKQRDINCNLLSLSVHLLPLRAGGVGLMLRFSQTSSLLLALPRSSANRSQA